MRMTGLGILTLALVGFSACGDAGPKTAAQLSDTIELLVPYDPGFRIGARATTHYFEVYADANEVQLSKSGGAPFPLNRDGARFYLRIRIKRGTSLRLYATRDDGVKAQSRTFRYLQEAPTLDVVAPDPTSSGTASTGTTSTDPAPPPPDSTTGSSSPTADVTLSVDAARDAHAISPYIYGFSGSVGAIPANLLDAGITLVRFGGNRLTAYNWENNASNAGSDWGPFASDDYLCWSIQTCVDNNAPGEAARVRIEAAHAAGAAALVTVPILGLVAADKAGNVSSTEVAQRFRTSVARKGSALTLYPDPNDAYVYQDEYVYWLAQKFPYAMTDARRAIFFSLDNEPALWPETHQLIHPAQVGYQELVGKTIDYAGAIKDVVPQAVVFGPVLYGWAAYGNLHNSSDYSRYGNFLDYYLAQMQNADAKAGRRLLDVLDLHWYPEAQGGGVRITFGSNNTSAVADARMQAPRSLWDPSYVESSWIANNVGAIRLLPRMREKIAAHYPGTKLAITEYNYGGTDHISGAIAQADVLGIFGRENLFAATYWPLGGGQDFVNAAFRLYRNFDGAGGHFGDTSVWAQSSDVGSVTVYASTDSNDASRMVVVAINKASVQKRVALSISYDQQLDVAGIYQVTATSPSIVALQPITVSTGNEIDYDLPPYSITTFALRGSGALTEPAPAPVEPSPAPSYDPGFRIGPNCNEWWVEAYSDAASMAFEIEGGARYALPATSWGSFATSVFVPRGTSIRLVATRSDGAVAYSTYFGFLDGSPSLAP